MFPRKHFGDGKFTHNSLINKVFNSFSGRKKQKWRGTRRLPPHEKTSSGNPQDPLHGFLSASLQLFENKCRQNSAMIGGRVLDHLVPCGKQVSILDPGIFTFHPVCFRKPLLHSHKSRPQGTGLQTAESPVRAARCPRRRPSCRADRPSGDRQSRLPRPSLGKAVPRTGTRSKDPVKARPRPVIMPIQFRLSSFWFGHGPATARAGSMDGRWAVMGGLFGREKGRRG